MDVDYFEDYYETRVYYIVGARANKSPIDPRAETSNFNYEIDVISHWPVDAADFSRGLILFSDGRERTLHPDQDLTQEMSHIVVWTIAEILDDLRQAPITRRYSDAYYEAIQS